MDLVLRLFDFIIHIDKYLNIIISQYGLLTYIILFIIIFCETGLVVTPFLPGDSLIFATGALAVGGNLNLSILFILLCAAAILGDASNYAIGHFLGAKMFSSNSKFLKKEYIDKTHSFYEKYGGKTIIIARFVPIVRTFAPFVAGIGKMSYSKFGLYNITGGILWVSLFLFSGFHFGNLPVVRHNFTLVIFAIIFISILPGVFAYIKERSKKGN